MGGRSKIGFHIMMNPDHKNLSCNHHHDNQKWWPDLSPPQSFVTYQFHIERVPNFRFQMLIVIKKYKKVCSWRTEDKEHDKKRQKDNYPFHFYHSGEQQNIKILYLRQFSFMAFFWQKAEIFRYSFSLEVFQWWCLCLEHLCFIFN